MSLTAIARVLCTAGFGSIALCYEARAMLAILSVVVPSVGHSIPPPTASGVADPSLGPVNRCGASQIRLFLRNSGLAPESIRLHVNLVDADGATTFARRGDVNPWIFDELTTGRYWLEITVPRRQRQVHVVDLTAPGSAVDVVTRLASLTSIVSRFEAFTYFNKGGVQSVWIDDELPEVSVCLEAVEGGTGDLIDRAEVVLSDGHTTFWRSRVTLPLPMRLKLPSPMLVEFSATGFAPEARLYEIPSAGQQGVCRVALTRHEISSVHLSIAGGPVTFSRLGCGYRPKRGITYWPATPAPSGQSWAFCLGTSAGQFVALVTGYSNDGSYWCGVPQEFAGTVREVSYSIARAATLVISPKAASANVIMPIDVHDITGAPVARVDGYCDVPRRVFLPPGSYYLTTLDDPDKQVFVALPPGRLTVAFD